jgi:hypothetical protein
MNELQEFISDCKKINPKITQNYHLVDGRNQEVYHPEIFGSEFFKDDLEKIINNFPIVTEYDATARNRLIGISKLINSSIPNITRLQKLKDTLDQLDHRRGTNWRLLFPAIDRFFQENKL